MSKHSYNLHLKGYVGGWDFDSDVVDYTLNKHADSEVHILIDSLGGSLATALSIVAAFRNHGNVHVHYVGMNASAATIASLGAKHVSIDSSAMYLVHKCSMEFFQWASANSDKLRDIIKQAEQMKADLDKMDANVAQMYAAKCKREPADLLALMKKGGWLTAQEALDWGFVDEITEYEDDAAPVITDLVAADLHAAGIPLPVGISADRQANGLMTRFIEALTNFFSKPSNKVPEMNPTNPTTQQTATPSAEQAHAVQAGVQTQNPATPAATPAVETPDAHAQAIADRDARIQALEAEIAALKGAPGDTTSHVIDNPKNPEQHNVDPSSPEAFIGTHNRARALFDELP